jgi:hypothetical protein
MAADPEEKLRAALAARQAYRARQQTKEADERQLAEVRETFAWCKAMGMTDEAIGDFIGCSRQNVNKMRRRAAKDSAA